MRELTTNDNPHTQILVLDEPGAGGACHRYAVIRAGGDYSSEFPLAEPLTQVKFQEGPIREHGVNGCQQEDLLAIVIDRLEAFQAGPFPCRENAESLDHCRQALGVLRYRTAQRQRRGVEGTNQA